MDMLTMDKKYPTPIHERVALAHEGKNPKVICRMPSGWAVLGDDQRLPGYSLLLSDPVAPSLNDLPLPERTQFLADLSILGDAILEVCKPTPIIVNYSILCNLDRALHAHAHPRYASEPDDKRLNNPFIYNFTATPAVPFDEKRDRPLIEKIRQAIEKTH
jgi:diadenosine tetraphosphate (Ap4A) HIT family hydrolase